MSPASPAPQVPGSPPFGAWYAPVRNVIDPPSRASFSSKFTTPAMASDPYCAAAPSLSSSTCRIAIVGITDMSGPCDPSAMPFPSHVITAARWRRFRFTRIRVWSGARLRRFAGLTTVAASEMGCMLTLNDGASVRMASTMFAWGCRARASAVSTSTGTADAITDRSSLLRLPTTTTVSAISKSSGRVSVPLVVSPYAAVIVAFCGEKPAMSAVRVHRPGRTGVNITAPAPSVAASIRLFSGPRA